MKKTTIKTAQKIEGVAKPANSPPTDKSQQDIPAFLYFASRSDNKENPHQSFKTTIKEPEKKLIYMNLFSGSKYFTVYLQKPYEFV